MKRGCFVSGGGVLTSPAGPAASDRRRGWPVPEPAPGCPVRCPISMAAGEDRRVWQPIRGRGHRGRPLRSPGNRVGEAGGGFPFPPGATRAPLVLQVSRWVSRCSPACGVTGRWDRWWRGRPAMRPGEMRQGLAVVRAGKQDRYLLHRSRSLRPHASHPCPVRVLGVAPRTALAEPGGPWREFGRPRIPWATGVQMPPDKAS